MKIYLIGYMASGKSRLGKELSERTGYPFVDLDEVFEERYRISILDFFEKYGETTFRKIESNLLRETAALGDAIVATGGGTPCFFDNMEFIRDNGISIYIRLTVSQLVSRLKEIRKKRPLLKDVDMDHLEAYVTEQLSKREIYYLKAIHVIDGPEIYPESIIGIIGQYPSPG